MLWKELQDLWIEKDWRVEVRRVPTTFWPRYWATGIVLASCLAFQANSSWRHQNQAQLIPSWGWARLHWVGGECRILCIFWHCGFGPHVCNDPCDRYRLRPLVRTPKEWGFAVWAFVELLGLSRVQDCKLCSWPPWPHECLTHSKKQNSCWKPCSECLKVAMGKRMPERLNENRKKVIPFRRCSEEACRHAEL